MGEVSRTMRFAPATQEQATTWTQHWQDEGDAAFLYRRIAALETDPARAGIFEDLAVIEERHAARWAEILEAARVPPRAFRPSGRARLLALVGRLFGWKMLVSMLLREEGREVTGYLAEARGRASAATGSATATGGAGATDGGAATATDATAQGVALDLARESAEHAERLGEILGTDGEPWHRTESGGFLRNAVYGFNDGLTANFGLVMGVLGADVPHHIVLVSGLAGLIADALSMGSSGYLASKSEQEVYAHEIATEQEELRVMPDIEEEELALLYQARGIGRDAARRTARDVMRHPEQALREKTQLELGITEASMSPLREGWITGIATAVGAFIPVLPFLVLSGRTAIGTSFAISMFSHFGVGAARSIFTGRGAFRSGVDMFVVGLGIAGIGYLVGDWIARLL